MVEYTHIEKKARKQVRYCQIHNVPQFAPKDGICFSCHRQIYEDISMKVAGKEHITKCCFCSTSFDKPKKG